MNQPDTHCGPVQLVDQPFATDGSGTPFGQRWGGECFSGFVNQFSADLMRDFPQIKGFSIRNLKYIRQWHEFWADDAVLGQQPVAQRRGARV